MHDGHGIAYLGDPATPTEGRAALLSEYGVWKMRLGDNDTAFRTFNRITSEAPTSRHSAEPYYWLAVAALKRGDGLLATSLAERIQIAQGSRVSLLSEWRLDCKAALLRSNLRTGSALQSANYTLAFQQECLDSIRADLRKM